MDADDRSVAGSFPARVNRGPYRSTVGLPIAIAAIAVLALLVLATEVADTAQPPPRGAVVGADAARGRDTSPVVAAPLVAGPRVAAPLVEFPFVESPLVAPPVGASPFVAPPVGMEDGDELIEGSGTTRPAPPTAGDPPGTVCFEPRFRDDFEGASLGSSWRVYDSAGAHSPHSIRHPDAISVGDGVLWITARNEGGLLTSGGIRLLDQQRYGKFAVKVRTDADSTNSTSGVILTWPATNDQARDGENNLYETLRAPGSRSPFYSFIHEPFDDRADGISQTRFVHDGHATRWQQVSMEWTPAYLSITVTGPDGGRPTIHRVVETDDDLIPDAEHFLTIQLDQFKPAFPDDRAVRMQVDWVEIWTYCGT